MESNTGGRGWSEQRPERCSLAGVTFTKFEWMAVTLVKNMYVSGVQRCTAVSVHAPQMSLAGLGGWARLSEDCIALPHPLERTCQGLICKWKGRGREGRGTRREKPQAWP